MWVQAGRNAARKSANTEAIRHFNKALDNRLLSVNDGAGDTLVNDFRNGTLTGQACRTPLPRS
jgi:hypothetical protein